MVSTSQKILFKNTFSLDEKQTMTGSLWKIEKKWPAMAKKSVIHLQE